MSRPRPAFTRWLLRPVVTLVSPGSCGTVDSAWVDAFVLVLVGGVVAVAAAVWLLGSFYPGSGAEQVGLRSSREITEAREALEAEDLDQMLAAHNARRRARGEPALTIDELVRQVSSASIERHHSG